MNFTNRKNESRPHISKRMRAGDLVIMYMGHSSLDHVYLQSGAIFQNKYGAFHHDDMIGQYFGCKIQSRISNGWIYVLEPSPELWSMGLHTRTQIVNELDSSAIVSGLDIFSGCKVVESGTGSGCFTMSVARAVFPSGHVYTFEYNEIRANLAREEFARLNLGDMITVSHRDICGKFREDEAGFENISPKSIDAVFFDLPEPWLALPYALHVLKPSRNICCYSPCMEQVMKTCEVLESLGFYNITMIEVRQRPYDGRLNYLENVDLGLDDGRVVNDGYGADIADATNDEAMDNDKDESDHDDEKESIDDELHDDEQPKKKQRNEKESKKESKPPVKLYRPRRMIPTRMSVARSIPIMKGHSAFLTFALCPTESMIAAKAKKSQKITENS